MTYILSSTWQLLGSTDPEAAAMLVKAPVAGGSTPGLGGTVTRLLQQRYGSTTAKLMAAAKAGTNVEWGYRGRQLHMAAYQAQRGDFEGGIDAISVQTVRPSEGLLVVHVLRASAATIAGKLELSMLWDVTLVVFVLLAGLTLLLELSVAFHDHFSKERSLVLFITCSIHMICILCSAVHVHTLQERWAWIPTVCQVGLITMWILVSLIWLATAIILNNNHRQYVEDITSTMTGALDIPLTLLIERSQLLTSRAEALWRAAGMETRSTADLAVPLTALFQSHGGDGGVNSTAISTVQLECLNVGQIRGEYFGIQKILGAVGNVCLFQKNATAPGACVQASGLHGALCNTTSSLALPDCKYDPRYTAEGNWETGWYESGRISKKLDTTALHSLRDGRLGASAFIPTYGPAGKLAAVWGVDFSLGVLVQMLDLLQGGFPGTAILCESYQYVLVKCIT